MFQTLNNTEGVSMHKLLKMAFIAAAFVSAQSASADLGGQVFYHYGKSSLTNARNNQVFTDTAGNSGLVNDSKDGWNIGAGLDLPLMKAFGPGDVLGQVMVDYAHHSKKEVVQTTSALLGGSNRSQVTVSTLNVLIAPKYRLDGLVGGKLIPWVIPMGLSFLVNSPPSNNTTYLDVGYHAGIGAEYKVIEALSAGLAYRTTIASKDNDVDSSYSTMDLYLGVNF
jgi:opacity protein-like surface antigen